MYAENRSKRRWLSGPEPRHTANGSEKSKNGLHTGKMAYGRRQMVYETSSSLREEKIEKTEPGSQTEAKHKRVRKSGGKARSRDSKTSG